MVTIKNHRKVKTSQADNGKQHGCVRFKVCELSSFENNQSYWKKKEKAAHLFSYCSISNTFWVDLSFYIFGTLNEVYNFALKYTVLVVIMKTQNMFL